MLLEFQQCFTDHQKFLNLYTNLQEKVVPSGKSLNRSVRILPLTEYDSLEYVQRLFTDPSRISSIEICTNCKERYALVHFPSHSAARKTLNRFQKWNNKHSVEWVSISGEVAGDVWDFKKSNRKISGRVSEEEVARCPSADTETAELLLGKELMAELTQGGYLSVAAEPFVPV